MKKQLLVLATVGLAVCCLAACDGTMSDEYDFMNDMLGANYSKVELTVTDTFDEDTELKSTYTFTYSDIAIKVDYSVEQLAELSLDDPLAWKITKTGSASIVGDKVVFKAGDVVDLSADLLATGLNFKKAHFENAETENYYLKADVVAPAAFLGSDVGCTDMKVDATFFDGAFTKIKISYTSQIGSAVVYTYTFTL